MHVRHNRALCELHQRHRDLFRGYIPALYPEFQKGGLLSIGMNPSSNAPDRAFRILSSANQPMPVASADELARLYQSAEIDDSVLNSVIALERLYLLAHPYHKTIKALGAAVQPGLLCQHLDLLPVRDTDQSSVSELVETALAFVEQCVQLLVEAVQWIEPKIILVENAGAAVLLNRYAPDVFPDRNGDVHPELGTHVTKEGTPVFYTGMLSGQRALDVGSRKRLIWHMRRVLQLAQK